MVEVVCRDWADFRTQALGLESPAAGKRDSGRNTEFADVTPKTQSVRPSIGENRKTDFPDRPRLFDLGVCSRLGWAVSS